MSIKVNRDYLLAPSWTESAVVGTSCLVGALFIGGGLIAYFEFNQWIVAAAVGGSGAVFDAAVIAGSLIYYLVTRFYKKGETLPELGEGARQVPAYTPTFTFEKMRSQEHGVKHTRDIYRIGQDGTVLWFLKADKVEQKRKYIPYDYLGYEISERLGLHVVPETKMFRGARQAAQFLGCSYANCADLSGAVILQRAVLPDEAKNPKEGDTSEDKADRALHVEVDIASAHKAIIFNLVAGRFDCGGSRAENTVIGKNGEVWEVDNDLLGKDVSEVLNISVEGAPMRHLHESWLITNKKARAAPFSQELMDTITQIDGNTFLDGVREASDVHAKIRNNLRKVQAVFNKNRGKPITPLLLREALKN